MPKRPKLFLGLAVAIIALILVGVSIKKNPARSTFQLTSAKNRFNLTFNLTNTDKNTFAKILQELNLPSTVSQGIEFELDSTPSAILDFTTPAKGTIVPIANSLAINGLIARSTQSTPLDFEAFNFPQDLNFALAGAHLEDAAKNYLGVQNDITDSVTQNSAAGAQYLASFGNGSSVYIFKTGTFDITSLKDKSPGQSYKEETVDNIKVYLLSQAVFEIGDYTYIVTSLDTAKAIIAAQKDSKSGAHFPAAKKGNFALLFINTDKNPAPESLLIKIFGTKEKIPNFINKLSKLDFTLNDKPFSALIELK